MSRGKGFAYWVEDRTGMVSGVKSFVREAVPSAVAWRSTLGSLAVALLLTQVLSGILMAVYYVPHPDAAYRSIEYVENEISGGAFVRALHHWGVSFILVTVALHMLRVFFSGAYKKPREVTWLVGVALLVLMILFAFTGQILPWNQAGYWVGRVGTEIAGSVPILGDSIERLLLGGEILGALTLTRFYALHVIVLPLLLLLFVSAHLYLLRRHGAAALGNDETAEAKPFSAGSLARYMAVVSLGLSALIIVSLWAGGPDSPPADPSDTSYLPHPEWYFMSHFELLRLTPGAFSVVSAFFIPAGLLLWLALLPWLDRKPGTGWRDRPVTVLVGFIAAAGVVGFTAGGMATQYSATDASPGIEAEEGTYDAVVAGREVYAAQKCRKCHMIDIDGSDKGPDLTTVGLRVREDYIRQVLVNPQKFNPESEMPLSEVSPRELDELVAYLLSLTELLND